MTIRSVALGLGWVACGVLGWSMALGDFTCQFPESSHIVIASYVAAAGPFGVVVSAALRENHVLLFKPLTTEQRYEAFHEQWPKLRREVFEEEYNGKTKPCQCSTLGEK